MKLNNKGWGLNMMLILCAVLLTFLLISAFLIVQFSKQLKDIEVDNYYSEIENNVQNAAVTYADEYYNHSGIEDEFIISTKELIKYGLLFNDDLKNKLDTCEGYAIVNVYDNYESDAASYITCKNYETSGFNKNFIE